MSFDTTKEAFYGDYAKAEDKLYLHSGSIEKESEFYYEYLTSGITCNVTGRYILDGVIVPQGFYQEDYVKSMTKFLLEQLSLEVVLFDRGFGSWGVILELKRMKIPFIIFWKKQGDWYQPIFDKLNDGEFKRIIKEGIYKRNKTNYHVNGHFILIKQYEYEEKKYDWIFATNLKLDSAEKYIKRYKKRWGIETIYRVTDEIRIFTTSTRAEIRCFLFLFTCFVYNVWKYFQQFLGEEFTLANCKVNMIAYLLKREIIKPTHLEKFTLIADSIL